MKNSRLKLHNLTKINFTQEGHPASSSHRRVAWHPDGQDHYSILISMRLFTVPSLYFQVLGFGVFLISSCRRHTDMPRRGSFVVLALPSMRLIQAKPGDCYIHQAWQEQLWRSLARILILLRLNRAEGGGAWRRKHLWYWLELDVQRIRQWMSRIRFNVIEITSVKNRVNGSDFGWKGDLFFGKNYEIL